MYDMLMIGGGVMSCATAYYLLKLNPRLHIAVVEMDPTYARNSTILSDGNMRVQFNIKENILMSKYGLEVMENFADEMAVGDDRPDPAVRHQGNLFIASADGREEALEGMRLQNSLGCEAVWLEPEQIQAHYPYFDSTRCAGATLGPKDGTMSPQGVLMGYRKKSAALGAKFMHGEVKHVLTQNGRVTGVKLADGQTLSANVVLNGAGAWAGLLAKTAGVALPVIPIKRQVTVVEIAERPGKILPAIFFPSGLYGMHEGGGMFTFGQSFPDDPETVDDFVWQRELFEERMWPDIVELMPVFDRLKIQSGWAGLYEVNTLDHNAILGEWPGLRGFYCANGFSGHGFQQCHAVGRYVAELMLGLPPALDLSIFSPQRILDNAPVFESKRKII
ncbi:MAG TPA: FAD-binding oxidoreductase [Thermoflexales bacterium]|mgnify:FL=1|nr:FAD-binding oxidoreductase [Thermoflexales bacterium]HQW34187.1 FAD-binding oxidoreductase [Thermoflexales bacterium]